MLTESKQSELQDYVSQNPFLSSDNVRVQIEENIVRLEGEVGSFFEKQMAQESIKQFDALAAIENAIEVYDHPEFMDQSGL